MNPRIALCCLLGLVGCDGLVSERDKRPDDETIDRLNRERIEEREKDLARVNEYRSWQESVRALDLVALGLPQDQSFGPVTGDPGFCDRLPSQATPSADRLLTEYRGHARVFRESVFPKDEASFRAHYLAERHMTRLACQFKAGGPEHRRAFAHLLESEIPAVRFTAALHTVNLDIARGAGYQVLKEIAGEQQFFTHAAAKALTQERFPQELGFDLERQFDRVRSRVERRGWKHVRLGRGARGR